MTMICSCQIFVSIKCYQKHLVKNSTQRRSTLALSRSTASQTQKNSRNNLTRLLKPPTLSKVMAPTTVCVQVVHLKKLAMSQKILKLFFPMLSLMFHIMMISSSQVFKTFPSSQVNLQNYQFSINCSNQRFLLIQLHKNDELAELINNI